MAAPKFIPAATSLDPNAGLDTSNFKRQMQLAALLSQGAGDKISSVPEGVGHVISKGLGGWMAGAAEADEKAAQSEASALQAKAWGAMLGGSDSIPTKDVGTPAPGGGGSSSPMKIGEGQQGFIASLMPHALAVSQETGLDPRIIIAQSALETGWGKSAPGNNFFGIKSHGKPGGNTMATTEVVNGQPVRTQDSFRAYADVGESAKDYANFLRSNPRYRGLLGAQGFDEQIRALGASGYATDPNYANKVRSIASGIQVAPPPVGNNMASAPPQMPPMPNAADVPAPNANPAAMPGQGMNVPPAPGGVAMTEEDVIRAEMETGMVPPPAPQNPVLSPMPTPGAPSFQPGPAVAMQQGQQGQQGQMPPMPPPRPPMADMPAQGAQTAMGGPPPGYTPGMLAPNQQGGDGQPYLAPFQTPQAPTPQMLAQGLVQGGPEGQMSMGQQAQAPQQDRRQLLAQVLANPRIPPQMKAVMLQQFQAQTQPRLTQVDLGNAIGMLDPQGNIVQRIPKERDRAPIAVGRDQRLVDPVTRQVIVDASGTKPPTVQKIKQPDGSEVSVQWDEATGSWVPMQAPQGGAAVRGPNKLTEQQSKDLGYYQRGVGVITKLDQFENELTSVPGRLAEYVPGGAFLQTEEFQRAQQAGREFVSSILRKDTGAAVTESEMALYGKMFLPQPGEKPGAIADKREARRRALEGIKMGLGTAEAIASAMPPATPSAPAAPGGKALKPGDIEDGHRWLGGPKGDPKSWEKVQ
jgi:flagellum-specific peptidoglycan hydrolase FlgJ